jgi:DNA-binding transcriptional MerR regulator
MASHSIGDLVRLLKVKIHVIRYWEKEVPLIQPVKDMYGRRLYRDRDLQILLRLKHLLYDRRFTLEGAKAQLYSEVSGEHQDLRSCVSALRSELLTILSTVQEPEAAELTSDTINDTTEDTGDSGNDTGPEVESL